MAKKKVTVSGELKDAAKGLFTEITEQIFGRKKKKKGWGNYTVINHYHGGGKWPKRN